jgi:hypothetical protein
MVGRAAELTLVRQIQPSTLLNGPLKAPQNEQ